MMRWHRRVLVICFLIIGLVVLPVGSFAETTQTGKEEAKISSEAIAVDAFLVRPLGIVAMLCGSVVFLVASPFAAMGGNTKEVWDTMVAEPASFTFQRPMGSFENGDDN